MLKVKIITGFRRDQEHSIDANEAHKAYYLFLNPEARTVFNDGLALKGSDIQQIVPDYQGTMGWNATHTLDSDDWNEMREKGIDKELREVLVLAQNIARISEPKDLNKPLMELSNEKSLSLK